MSELRGLTWDAINLHEKTITVRQGISQQEDLAEPKSHAGRRPVPLGTLAARFCKPLQAAATDLVWPGETYSRLLHQMQYRAAKLGIAFKGFGFHTLRRTYATFRHLLGSDPRPQAALVAAMGHANAEMTDHYIQADVDVVDKLRDLVFFSGITREKPV